MYGVFLRFYSLMLTWLNNWISSRWSPIGHKLRHHTTETDTFEYPEALKTRIAHSQLSLSGPEVAGALAKARAKHASKFIDQYDAESQPQSWFSKLFTNKSES